MIKTEKGPRFCTLGTPWEIYRNPDDERAGIVIEDPHGVSSRMWCGVFTHGGDSCISTDYICTDHVTLSRAEARRTGALDQLEPMPGKIEEGGTIAAVARAYLDYREPEMRARCAAVVAAAEAEKERKKSRRGGYRRR